MSEQVLETAWRMKGFRSLTTATGFLAGFGVGYLVCFFIDVLAEPPMYYWGLIDMLLPFVVLSIVLLVFLIRKPLPIRDASEFVVFFWVPFLSLYLVTHLLYWAPKI